MEKKSLRNDLILIGSLLLVAIISLVVVLSTRTKDRLIAKIYVRDEVVEVIDLSKKEETFTQKGAAIIDLPPPFAMICLVFK